MEKCNFKELYNSFLGRIDRKELMKNTKELLDLEYGVTFDAYHASARRALELLREKHIPNARMITFPADGVTSYQDKITPLGWKATKGKITIVSANGIPSGTVIADFEAHPFQLIKGSTATKEGGELMRIISEEQVTAGEDPRDALILCSPRFHHSAPFISHFLDLGARGFITDYAKNADDTPQGIQWCNAHTEKGSWHVNKGDRDFIGFSITPAMGNTLRGAIAASANSKGNVIVHVESDGIRYESTIDLVTALIPGKRKEEFWIFAHLYEPLGNDNSSGVAAAMETARLIMEEGTPEFSLRLLFGLEMYGFAAYASTRGENLSREVVGGINYDALYLRKGWGIDLYCAGPGTPFFGNYLAKQCAEELNTLPGLPHIHVLSSAPGMYLDDTFLGDSTTGVPTIWAYRTGKNYWHNSMQTFSYVEEEPFAMGCAVNTALTHGVIFPDKEFLSRVLPLAEASFREELGALGKEAKEQFARRYEILKQDLDNFQRFLPESALEKPKEALDSLYEKLSVSLENDFENSPWRDLAEEITPKRLTTGFPYDLARIPFARRKRLPGPGTFGPLSNILANMDGKRTLGKLFRMAEYEIRKRFTENEIKEFTHTLFYLARYGYISMGDFRGLTKDDIVKSLREAGIKKGDLLCVHSSLTNVGIVEGGAKTYFEALREAVGEEGTFMTPAFNASFAYLGGPNKNKAFLPYDKNDPSLIWTGALPRYMMEIPGVIHSEHISHSFCIYGKDAEELAGEQKMTHPPMGSTSPLMKMLAKGGKILHLGSPVSSTTFLHCIEDAMELPGIQTSLCLLKTSCSSTPLAVERNVPGCRSFYTGDEESIPFFAEARKRGLSLRKVKMGLEFVRVMDMGELFRIGCEIAGEDPFIFLHNEKEEVCLACERVKREYLGRKA